MTVTPEVRPFRTADRASCIELFDANCPDYFAPNERDEYLRFLERAEDSYEVCLLDGRIVGAFGLQGDGRQGLGLRWILVSPAAQGLGLGSAIMARVLATVRRHGPEALHIAASHKSAPFFARFGAREIGTTLDGWGPGMHRVDMRLDP